MDFATLRSANFAGVDTAGDAWSSVAGTAARLNEDYQAGTRLAAEAWSSGSDITARERTQATTNLTIQFEGAAAEANALKDTLRWAVEEFEGLQRKLETTIAEAQRTYTVTVNADGSVTYPPAPDSFTDFPELVKEWNATGQASADAAYAEIDAVVREAAALDEQIAARLRAISETGSPDDWTFNGNALVDAIGADIPVDEGPAAVKSWWDGLSDEEKQRYIAMCPSLIGGLDGIPAVDRDQANRIVLDQEESALERQVAEMDRRIAEDDREHPNRNDVNSRHESLTEQRDALQAKLDALNGIEEKIEGPSPVPGQNYYLLKLDAANDGQAIVSVGNPDTADNVAVYVPGTDTDLWNLDKDLIRMDKMAKDSFAAASGSQTATMLWLGYDAPDGLTDAMDTSYADNAAAGLDRFTDGLRTTHTGPPANATLVGHSYGSTVIGIAARDQHLNVDNMVFIGSPGVGVSSAAELGVPPDHVWATATNADPIPKVPGGFRSTAEAYLPGGFIADWVDGAAPENILGVDPMSDEFGAHTFDSDTTMNPFTAHGSYWDAGNAARDNMAFIITGQPDAVE